MPLFPPLAPFPAAAFLLFAFVTGVLVAMTEFFGEAEALREATRGLISPVHLADDGAAVSATLLRALATANGTASRAPVDKIVMQFKGDRPTVEVYTGHRQGGEDRRLIFDAKTGALVAQEAYVDKPLIHRVHSGEAFGDGGLVFAMFWGVALAVLTLTGIWIYWLMRRPGKVFW